MVGGHGGFEVEFLRSFGGILSETAIIYARAGQERKASYRNKVYFVTMEFFSSVLRNGGNFLLCMRD